MAYPLIELDSIDSTNDEAKRLIKSGKAENGMVITAKRQTGGRGRMDRVWESPEGNLYLSMILKLDSIVADATELSFVAAVALGEVLQGLMGESHKIEYKWPNDILVNKEKISGILLESIGTTKKTDWVIVGVGVNIDQLPQGQTNLPATSLKKCGLFDVTIKELLTKFIYKFNEELELWNRLGFAEINEKWKSREMDKGRKGEREKV